MTTNGLVDESAREGEGFRWWARRPSLLDYRLTINGKAGASISCDNASLTFGNVGHATRLATCKFHLILLR
jgi:hypothetical protein